MKWLLILLVLYPSIVLCQSNSLGIVEFQNFDIQDSTLTEQELNMHKEFPIIFPKNISFDELSGFNLYRVPVNLERLLYEYDILKQIKEMYLESEMYILGKILLNRFNKLSSFLILTHSVAPELEYSNKIYALNFVDGKLKSILKLAEEGYSSRIYTLDKSYIKLEYIDRLNILHESSSYYDDASNKEKVPIKEILFIDEKGLIQIDSNH